MKPVVLLARLLVLFSLFVPAAGALSRVSVARADSAPQPIWQHTHEDFTPATQPDAIADTFTATASAYLVDITVAPMQNNVRAALDFQLGDDGHDSTLVYAGEERFFVPAHLKAGSAPLFRVTADPSIYTTSDETFSYSVQVFALDSIPTIDRWGVITYSGTVRDDNSSTANVLAFPVPEAGIYDLHYAFDESLQATVSIYSASGHTDSDKLSGQGDFSARLPTGIAVIVLKTIFQIQPSRGWAITVERRPNAGNFQPRSGAVLSATPDSLSVVAEPGATMVLDGQPVPAHYDPGTRRLTYRTTAVLAPGQHGISTQGPDGQTSEATGTFIVLPPSAPMPRSNPAGRFLGQPWMQTVTPDGRYSLQMPASWRMVTQPGLLALAGPQGSPFLLLITRYRSGPIDALATARTIGAAMTTHLQLSGPWRYAGSTARAGFSAATRTGGKVGVTTNLVLPDAGASSLLLAFGFGSSSLTGDDAVLLSRIEGSITSNNASQVEAARIWLPYHTNGLALQLPQGWLADYSGSTRGVSWFIGPDSGALLVGISQDGTTSGGIGDLGEQATELVSTEMHDIHMLHTETLGNVYRWEAVFVASDGSTVGLELGQAVLHGTHFQALWADTDLTAAAANLPIFDHMLDSQAAAAGQQAPLRRGLAQVLDALRERGGLYASALDNAGQLTATARQQLQLKKVNDEFSAYQNALSIANTMYQTNQITMCNMSSSCSYAWVNGF